MNDTEFIANNKREARMKLHRLTQVILSASFVARETSERSDCTPEEREDQYDVSKIYWGVAIKLMEVLA